MPSDQFLLWMREMNENVHVKVEQIPFSKMREWHFTEEKGNLVHQSASFFSVEGIRVRTNWGNVSEWEQPIINQPEVGFLGIITKNIQGILFFLMQAKIEPGNLNYVQLSPTLQATRSNYTRVHKGKTPLYLEYFNGTKQVRVLLDQLQSEQGSRFLKKRNRNMIVQIGEDEDINVPENFCWLTLGQIKSFLQYDNLVNMDTRTVISGIDFGSYPADALELYKTMTTGGKQTREMSLLLSFLEDEHHYHDLDEIISWITKKKSLFYLEVDRIPLRDVSRWILDCNEIYHETRKYFTVIGVNVEIGNREVQTWDQPLIMAVQEGIIAFIIRKIDGVYHFLVQAKVEAGNFDLVEMAPTVQCIIGNYRKGENEYEVMFLDEILKAQPQQIWYSAYQSEEGGRFFREQNKNMIVEVGEEFSVEVPDNFIWMTLNQIKVFINFNNYLNIAARSLIAAVRFC
jgi:dTDP-4-dehydro-6-deoxy-alpha-D-glucopyranose 2,3-dehydratase